VNESESADHTIARTRDAGRVLRGVDHERVIHALANAAKEIANPDSALSKKARAVLPARTGLSPANIERTLSDSLHALCEEELKRALTTFERAFDGHTTIPVSLAGMILAGNVFTASLRPIAWSLLLRVPALVKPSSNDEGLSELFVNAISEVDPEIGAALGIVRFGRTEQTMFSRLGESCDVLHVWGSDETITEIRTRLRAATSLVPHGHGLGAIYVPKVALLSLDSAERVAAQIALDTSLYDQRGCLSPHVVFAEKGARISPIELARMLGEQTFAEIEKTIPRGPLPIDVGASQVQWRGLGAVRGELFEGERWAVSFEGKARFRSSPGFRNLAVHEVDSLDELGRSLAPLGTHLKALGVAGELDLRREVAGALPSGLAPRISETGEMQRPGLLASADGERPWSGFVRILDLE
jgi:hypothetical protein